MPHPHATHPMPHASTRNLMPYTHYAPCPMSHTPCHTPHTGCRTPTPDAPCPNGPRRNPLPHVPHHTPCSASMGAFSFQWAPTPNNTGPPTGQNPSNQPITTKPLTPTNPSTTRKRPLKKKYAHAAADRLLRTSPAPCLISCGCAHPQRRPHQPRASPAAAHSTDALDRRAHPPDTAQPPIMHPKPHLPDHTYRHTQSHIHSRTYNHAYSGLMSNARYRKSRCSVSRFSATVSSLVMCVIPVNGKYVCSRPAAISACESRSEWAMVTLSSEKP